MKAIFLVNQLVNYGLRVKVRRGTSQNVITRMCLISEKYTPKLKAATGEDQVIVKRWFFKLLP